MAELHYYEGERTDWLVFFPASNHGISLGVQTLIKHGAVCEGAARRFDYWE